MPQLKYSVRLDHGWSGTAESIYGTTANPFGELPWGYCTVKPGKLYLFVRDWPKDGVLTLHGLKNTCNISIFTFR